MASTSAGVTYCFPIILLLRAEGMIQFGALHAEAVWQCQSCFSVFLERLLGANHLLLRALMAAVFHSGWRFLNP